MTFLTHLDLASFRCSCRTLLPNGSKASGVLENDDRGSGVFGWFEEDEELQHLQPSGMVLVE